MNKKIIIVLTFVIALLAFFFLYRPSQTHNPSVKNETKRDSHSASTLGSPMPIDLSTSSEFNIRLFAEGLTSPRDLQFTPSGTLLVSSPTSNSVYALADTNMDGIADSTKTIISGENHVHGLAIYNNHLFIADVDKVVRYTWDEASLTATKDKVLFSLPQNSNHNARTIIFDEQGKMYVSVGSTCNVCSEKSPQSATILISDQDGNNPHIYASGLRNAPFLAFNPTSHELWATEMGRDNLGDSIPPDEINIIKDGANYGWPYCYGDKVHDNNFDSTNTHSCDKTVSPIFHIPAHSAPLGLTFINSSQFPSSWQGDLLVALHGSWNRTTPIGYKIVHLKVDGNTASNSEDFVTGFLPEGAAIGPSSAEGRPVDLTFDIKGNLYISDDKAGNIYIVSKK